jgi:uncharacterized protein (UPF0333 family)
MRKSSGILVAACLLVATPALAGSLDFNNGEASWRSTRCEKPVPTTVDTKITSETRGNELNALIAQRNAYADKVQAYMNCISKEAENDQSVTGQAIASGAQKEIDAVRADLDKVYGAPRSPSAK